MEHQPRRGNTIDGASGPPEFPAGPFLADESHDNLRREAQIDELQRAPTRLREAVSGLTDEQLDTKYRNWTIRQIVHHLADSHLNSYVRFKLTLTEERPTIKPYDESRWSLLADAQRADVELSLRLLEVLHARWAYLLRSLGRDAFERSFHHPEAQEIVPLWRVLAYYVWHARHHTAQIEWMQRHKLTTRGGQ
jgi:uncharacterized damage-inducible protein DinB